MRGGGTINADGFGIGWLVGDPGHSAGQNGSLGGRACRYRSARPMWSDPCLPGLAASVTSGAIVAAVRSATVGMPVTEAACAPFLEGAWMFSHNGMIDGWPDSVATLAEGLPAVVLMTLDAPTDSAFLWALVREHLRRGHAGVTALATVSADILAVAPASRLNLLLHDGQHIFATTVTHALWFRQDQGSVTVSSETLNPDQLGWQQVPDLSLLEATTTHVSIRPLLDPPLLVHTLSVR
jgi:glutamine amidotransferase